MGSGRDRIGSSNFALNRGASGGYRPIVERTDSDRSRTRASAGSGEPTESLVDRIVDRDLAAFEQLYREYQRRLFGFVFRLTRRSDLVEEIVQETLLVVWRDARKFDRRSRFSTWILGIAYRRALKTMSGEARRSARESTWAGERSRVAEAPLNPERLSAGRESAEALWRALAELTAEQRAVIELTFVEGCSYGEIAELLDCPVNTIKTRMFHARRRLRELLPEILDGGEMP